jgi:hypothetical protein
MIDVTSVLDEREPDRGVEYRCGHCGGIFPYEMTEAQAEAIYERDFPGYPKDRRVMACRECYAKARKRHSWL